MSHTFAKLLQATCLCAAVAFPPMINAAESIVAKLGAPGGHLLYNPYRDGCMLAIELFGGVDINKSIAKIGESVQTKYGKWLCTRIVVDQHTGATAAVWAPAQAAPH